MRIEIMTYSEKRLFQSITKTPIWHIHSHQLVRSHNWLWSSLAQKTNGPCVIQYKATPLVIWTFLRFLGRTLNPIWHTIHKKWGHLNSRNKWKRIRLDAQLATVAHLPTMWKHSSSSFLRFKFWEVNLRASNYVTPIVFCIWRNIYKLHLPRR